MRIVIKGNQFEEIKDLLTSGEKSKVGRKHRFFDHKDKLHLNIVGFCDESLQKIRDYLDGLAQNKNRSAALSRNIVDQWMVIKKNPHGQVVKKLEAVESSMRAYIETVPHRYLFQSMGDDNYVPWMVTEIKYHAPNARTETPAQVIISLTTMNGLFGSNSRGSRKEYDTSSIAIYASDFRGLTMGEILQNRGYFLETPEQYDKYVKEMNVYQDIHNREGMQLSVIGNGLLLSGWYERDFRPVEKAGIPAKMVIDPNEEEEQTEAAIECPFWTTGIMEDELDEDEETHGDEEPLWELPLQPYLRLFDLEEHCHFKVHVNNVTVYEYDTEVGKKLVLPDDTKEILDILVADAEDTFQDIVSGKEGGVIVMCEGPPGTGKTLTAEVYSEVVRRPLYKVQSSQLGITIKELEDELKTVLRRAERWGAILLIDEADVYVSARGEDIHQNAIVGIFLRVLEYYRGVLFLTTNRGTLVDDAIISRILATITYENPDEDLQTRLWRILADQNGIALSNAVIPKLVTALPECSGRDIKNLLKLASKVSKARGEPIDVPLVKTISKFSQSQEKKGEES